MLDTAPEHRVRPLLHRLGEVLIQVTSCEQRDEPTLCALRDAIIDFQHHAVAAELSD
ncbi:MAG: hypothetical protein ACRDTF_10745 [Pseudonocardiaceae bacterium]